VRQDELRERPVGVAQRQHRARVRDRRLDLLAVADDAHVGEQSLHVRLAEVGDPLGVEAREGGPERLALAQDRDPREARLEGLEADPLVQAALVDDRTPPLLVVVAGVQRVTRAETANSLRRGIAQGCLDVVR
jgi:hypothetical protein